MSIYRKNLTQFLDAYTGNREVIDIDVPDLSGTDRAPFIILRHGDYALVLDPMGLADHLDLDAFAFVKGEAATAAPWGMSNGRRSALPDTGTTSHGWPSTDGVSVLVGEQAKTEVSK